jgi:hypothetical protein
MATWTSGEGDDLVVIKITGTTITISIPSGQPIATNAAAVAALRALLGAAIAVAQGEATS